MKPLNDALEAHQAKLQSMARVFTRAFRILSAEDVVCKVVSEPYKTAPAWTDGTEITFNADQISNISSVQSIVQLTGLGYHELSHVLYTPRVNSVFFKTVKSNGWFQTANILEDQRIETLLTSLYPATIPYFISTFTRYCTQKPEDWEVNFVLMYGRKYLPIAMRETFERKFKYQEDIKQHKRLLDKYRKLVYPRDYEEGIEIVGKYHKLLNKHQTPISPSDPNGHSTSHRCEINSGTIAPTSEQQDVADLISSQDEALEERDEDVKSQKEELENESTNESNDEETDSNSTENVEDDSDSEEDSETSDSEGDGNTSDSDSEDDDEDGFGSSSDSEEDDDKDNDSSSSKSGDGVGDKKDTTESEDEDVSSILDMLKEEEEAIMQDSQVVVDTKEKQSTIVNGDGDVTISLPRLKYSNIELPQSAIFAKDEFATELRKLRSDVDPGWESGYSSGRINPVRLVRGDELETVFDRFNEGLVDNTEIEAVVLLDVSGSMQCDMEDASLALWVIKSALETVESHVTVLAFSDDAYTLYDKHETTENNSYRLFPSVASTHPTDAIKESVRVFTASERANKICFLITDGQWSNNLVNHELINHLNQMNVLTAIAHIGGNQNIPLSFTELHNCKVGKYINKVSDLVGMATEITSLSYQELQ